MDFAVEQRYGASPLQVIELYADPAFHASLGAGPHIGPPEVLDHTVDGRLVLLDIRYRFTADLPSAARRFVEPDRLTWVEHLRIDLDALTTTSKMEPDHYASLMAASARSEYLSDPAGRGSDEPGCLRRIVGRLSVKVPLVGSRVERAIVEGLQEHLDIEQEKAARRLA